MLPMSPAADRLRRYLAAYAARDLSAIEGMLAEDATLQDWNVAVQGKAQVLAETRRNFDAASRIEITERRMFSQGDTAAAELHIVVDGAVALDVVDVVQFDATGAVRQIRSYKG